MNVIDTDARFVIDPVSGDIANNSLKETIARYSHNSEVFTFEIPRNIGHDPVECNLIEIHYLNINARNKTETSEGIYKVNDIHAENDESAIFTWTIDGSATVFAGTLSFSIHFKCIDSEGKCLYRLPIKTYSKITVTDAIDNSGVVMEDNQDIIAEWEARISALEENGGGGGAGVFFVDVVVENLGETVQEVLETEFAHIVEAYNNDYSLICRETFDTTLGGNITYYTLDTVQRNNGDISSFSFTNSESRTSFIIFSDGTLDYRKFNDGVVLSVNGNEPDMNGNVEIATGDSKSIFYVTAIRSFYGESLSVTTDWNDIVGAYISGKTLICKITDEGMGGFLFAHLSSVDSENPTSFTFICEYFEVTIGEDFGMVYERLSNNQIQSSINDLNTDMGNISTALDHIIEIQNQMIGGDGV